MSGANPEEERKPDEGGAHINLKVNGQSSECGIICHDPIADKFLRTTVHNEEEAYESYCVYAHHVGFTVRKDHSSYWSNSKKIKTKDFICGKAGQKRERKFSDTLKFRKADTRTGCQAMVRYAIDIEGKWTVKKFVESHNHPLADSGDKHLLRSSKKISELNADVLRSMTGSEIRETDAYNFISSEVGGVHDKSNINERVGCSDLRDSQMINASSSGLLFRLHAQKFAYELINKAQGNEQAEQLLWEAFKKLYADLEDILAGRTPQAKKKTKKKSATNMECNVNDPINMQPKETSTSRLKGHWEENKRAKRKDQESSTSRETDIPCEANMTEYVSQEYYAS